ncbi:type II secretion system protein [Hydrogenimonas thermophila]|uniref:type II secretion system protein n=1 Tax=Hydrogenimonas thermophila TaxID=223786 RepID=UPI002937129B|nr:type II secretion system protein [Hydrogenimonas thermophila]WOE70605.1 type II secretion system protein [Hydrogenimonas thermophila]WOE73123.1 type II secretion system protein [Hydrogenimonas thermophila]
MRHGFTLLLAIVIMVLIGTLMSLMLSFTTTTLKQTEDIYLKEQAELIARSATEYALLKISGNNWSNGECINNINDLNRYKNFDVNITIYYFGKNLPSSCNILANNLYTKESNGTALIDVIVSTTDPITSEKINFHKRTIQKP